MNKPKERGSKQHSTGGRMPGIVSMVLSASLAGLAGCGAGTVAKAGCDSTPGNLTGTCNLISAHGQCVEWTGLGTSDQNSLKTFCATNAGTWGDSPCTTATRIGSCAIPPTDPGLGIHCSPSAVTNLHYFSNNYTLDSAKALCDGVAGTTWTPG